MKSAVLGFGTVGKGVYEMIKASGFIEAGPVLVLPQECNQPFMVTSIEEIAKDKSVDVVVECMGGVDKAFEFASTVIESGKSFVTSNKALVVAKGLELLKLAQEHDVAFLFSAACGGAIPILHNISIAKKTDRIKTCGGILNGTTNFILSGLQEKKFTSYQEALTKAQELGYAEADPRADVSGMDTMRKVILLSSVAFNILPESGYNVEGIENIDLCPSEYGPVKLIGKCGLNEDGSVYAFAEPVICKSDSIFAAVNSNYNLAFYDGTNSGPMSIIGQGAGRYPTASAVLRDLSAISEGKKDMFDKCCVGAKAYNGDIVHKYVVSDGKTIRITNPVSVARMHEDAGRMRKNGSKVFFAAIED